MPRSIRNLLPATALFSAATGLALAQAVSAPPEASDAAARARVEERRAAVNRRIPAEFGPSCCSILQIPAAACQNFQTFFVPHPGGYLHPLDPGLSYCWAPVELPTGVVVVFVDLYYDDMDASNDIVASLLLNPGYTSSGSTLVQSVSSSGSSGKGYAFSNVFSHTINHNPSAGGGQYMIGVFFNQSSGESEGFKGVDLWYYRQVSPAPGTPTFSDVPISDPAFQFIEAFAAAAITAGCQGQGDPPKYCPDDFVTRRQMAVFFARALGLNWPY